jgi:hypothetical protein
MATPQARPRDSGQPGEALTLCETALGAHDYTLGRDHDLTNDSARVTADALDALVASTPASRANAAKLLISGPRQGQFEMAVTAVSDLYQTLAKAGR